MMAAFKEPLYLPTPTSDEDGKLSPSVLSEERSRSLCCLLCDDRFSSTNDQDLLRHLLETHSLVIEDAPGIADLPAYCR